MINIYKSELDYEKTEDAFNYDQFLGNLMKELSRILEIDSSINVIPTTNRAQTDYFEVASSNGYVKGYIEKNSSLNNQAREGRYAKLIPLIEEELIPMIYVPALNDNSSRKVKINFAIWASLGFTIISNVKEAKLGKEMVFKYLEDSEETLFKLEFDPNKNEIFAKSLPEATLSDKTGLKLAMIAQFAKKYAISFFVDKDLYDTIKFTALSRKHVDEISEITISKTEDVNGKEVVIPIVMNTNIGSLDIDEVPDEISDEEARQSIVTSQKASTRRHTIAKIKLSNELRTNGLKTIIELGGADVVSFNGEQIDIYEVKTGGDSFYKGIGQLLVYKQRIQRMYPNKKINLKLVHPISKKIMDEDVTSVLESFKVELIELKK